MSDRQVPRTSASKDFDNAAVALRQANDLRDEILEKLDDVYGIVFDGPEFSSRQLSLLALLPEEELRQIASYAEEYAANVADYGRLVRAVMKDNAAQNAR